MNNLLPVGTPVLVLYDVQGTVVGYGVDHDTGDFPRPVYLVSLRSEDSGYIAKDRVFVRMLVVHPDNVVTENSPGLTDMQYLLFDLND